VRPELKTLFSAKDALAQHNNSRTDGMVSSAATAASWLSYTWGPMVEAKISSFYEVH